jgi:molecular chaperone HscB
MIDYFHFYNLPSAFLLDEQALRQKYLQLSKQYHPDFYGMESEEKQAEALELSTLNNEAYKVLSDFDKRFAYILKSHGLLEEGENKKALPQSFLMEMMDINEEMMEFQFDPNNERRERLQKNLIALKTSMLDAITPSMQQYQRENASENLLNELLIYYLKTRYLKRLEENLNKSEENIKNL